MAHPSSAYMMAELCARQARWNHDYAEGARQAAQAANYAAADADVVSWWDMSNLRAQCLCDDGLLDAAIDSARHLARHDLAQGDPARRSAALNLLAIAYQGAGELHNAMEAASEAADLVRGQDSTVLIRIQCTQVAVNAERGDLDSARQVCQDLLANIADVTDVQLIAKAYWAIGNVAFLRGDTKRGQHYHEYALLRLSPSRDLEMWGNFNKGSAAMRLHAGIADSATLRCIERAELSAEIVGASTQDHLLLTVARAHWNLLAGDFEAAIDLLVPVCELSDQFAAQSSAEALFLLGKAQLQAGRAGEGVANARSAAAKFDEAGASERRADVCEFVRVHS